MYKEIYYIEAGTYYYSYGNTYYGIIHEHEIIDNSFYYDNVGLIHIVNNHMENKDFKSETFKGGWYKFSENEWRIQHAESEPESYNYIKIVEGLLSDY